jgi:aryl-alcohol dehydrogenase
VLVKMVSASICHTDIGGIQGHFTSLGLPVVLGHEGAGIVMEVGDRVSKVKPGDHVVISVVVHCGRCGNCRERRYYGCERFNEIAFGGGMPDGGSRLSRNGNRVSHFFAQSSFANYSVVPETIVVPISTNVQLEKMSPLSCGVQTGCGAVMNGGVTPGSSIAIFGCGGVGLSAVMAARVIGASEIFAVDVSKERLSLAESLGATQTINGGEVDPSNEIKDATSGEGVDFSLECVGRQQTIDLAIKSAREFGTIILVGVPPPGTKLDFHSIFHRNVRGCIAGYANSDTFIPYLLKLHEQGRLPFDQLSPKSYSFDQINVAIKDMQDGTIVKPLLKF